MTEDTAGRRDGHAVSILLLLAVAGALLACESQAPEDAAEADASRRPAAVEFIPYDVAPELQNAEQVSARLQELYPDSLEEAGVGGSVVLWLEIDERGRVQRSLLQESSEHGVLDRAASRIAGDMSFSPARSRGRPVAVWVQQRIRFEPDTGGG